jgi:two-component system NtrC family response regulator
VTSQRPSILVVEDDAALADQIRWALKDEYRVSAAPDRDAALGALKKVRPDLVLVDLCLPPENTPEEGFKIVRSAREAGRDTVVVVMSGVEERAAAQRAVAEGAYDFFHKPVDVTTLRVVVGRALERQRLERENRRLREELRRRYQVDGLVGAGPAMQRVAEAIHRVKDSPVTVLLQGESGTGKELVSRAIHYNGARRDGPFVPVHCAALPETLLESELFGHERGAFTGAQGIRVGRFEAAHGGTLFLDEIACLTGSMQVKLLRVLEERVVERLGSNRRRPVDIRLIVATNEDLQARVRRGELREDFFFRVSVFPIRLPPLRERREDVPILADFFLKRILEERGGPPRRFTAAAHQALARRSWPGNVRELLNAVETLALLAEGEEIGPELVQGIGGAAGDLPTFERVQAVGFKAAMDEIEKAVLAEGIARAGGVKSKAAQALKLDASQMKYLVRKHSL